jgi:hypothetical protein
MRLLLSFMIAGAMLAPIKASAATEYMLYFVHYMPYSKTPMAGPFDTYQECSAVMGQSSYVSGGGYECDTIFVPG